MRKLIFITGFNLVLLLCGWHANAQDIIANGGVLYVKTENTGNPGENSSKLIDNNISTKYLVPFTSPLWVIWKCATADVAAQYTMTSANDAATRDPKDWQLLGSNDSTNWITLDTRTGETFPSRLMTKTYTTTNTTAYIYYKLNITANNGSANFQQAEWRLFQPVPPAAPTVLQAAAVSGGQISLNWTDNAINESAFQIERSANGINFSLITEVASNIISYLDQNLLVNTQYYYRVRSKNPYGFSAYTNIANATTLNYGGTLVDITDDGGNRANGRYIVQYDTLATPATERPEKLIDNDINSKYLIFLGSPPNNPVTPDYWVQYQGSKQYILRYYNITSANDAPDRDPKNWELLASNDGVNWTIIDTRTNQVFVTRFLTRSFYLNNTTPYAYYRWHVTANNGSTNIAGQIGEWELYGFDPNAPLPPKNLTITAVTDTTIRLNWQDVSSNETGFEVSRSEDNITFISVATTAANATTYLDQFLFPGFRYYYRVRSVSSSGSSFWSNVADTTTTIDPNLPRSPRNLVATGISNTDIQLTWQDFANNETGFQVERSTDSLTFALIGSVGANVTTYTDPGRTVATRYYYRVRANNTFGNSYYSNIARGITTGQNQAPTVTAISNLATCKINTTQTIAVTGITPGPETWQTVNLFIRTNNGSLFDSLFVSTVSGGQATITYKTKNIAGIATITLTAKDNGFTWNGGTDSLVRSFTITVSPLPVAITSNMSTTVPRNTDVQLTATGAQTYLWNNANGIISGQNSDVLTIRPTLNTVYNVTGSNSQGCSNTAMIAIQLSGDHTIEAVNILTPNGDGKNDRWVIWNIGTFPDNEVRVFDRAGRLVFYKKNYSNDWDGTYNGSPLPEGAYIYVIDPGRGIEKAKGVLTILRK